ncbi:hypothetical protein BOTBODRAFT_426628 [Botryobasidium botryosum FD-172 SS1]|uniref:Uncharacterized protein n=1 Tax=Botryobasidium botryosum (strain FD-172 SS1) TaxID=930990 RepID=A0A067M8V5_BOTB1|nr:hypothetical protein BOTBODRAFT_426628 [Botryobasidium botryosum FD-172 SS1]
MVAGASVRGRTGLRIGGGRTNTRIATRRGPRRAAALYRRACLVLMSAHPYVRAIACPLEQALAAACIASGLWECSRLQGFRAPCIRHAGPNGIPWYAASCRK